jgi:hypothetical protein
LAVADALATLRTLASSSRFWRTGLPWAGQLVQLCRTVAVAGRQVHDANIVATMLAHGETCLRTSNRSEFRRFGQLIEILEP